MRQRLEQIYRDHRQGLYTLALAITRSCELAEDAVQEAFARLWRSGREPQGDAVAYVFAAVRNAAVEYARRRHPDLQPPDSIFYTIVGAADPPSEEAEELDLLRQQVEALPSRQRQAVVLRLYAGMTFQQMAETLGEPLPTVASRYRRALEKIKAALRREA